MLKPKHIFLTLLIISSVVLSFSYLLTQGYDFGNGNCLRPVNTQVIFSGNHTGKVIITWRTISFCDNYYILYDTVSHGRDLSKYSFKAGPAQSGKIVMKSTYHKRDTKNGYYYRVELRDLNPETNYYFVIENDGEVSFEYSFSMSSDT